MTVPASTILRFGPYLLPQGYCVGDTITCAYRGRDVVIAGTTDASVPWFSTRKRGKPFLIVCGDLIRAIQTESEAAVAHHWGVNKTTVWHWRRALKVERMTAGTTQVFQILFESRIDPEIAEKGRERSRSEESRRKMIASKTGRSLHRNTRTALLIAVKRPKTQAHREAISRAHVARGTLPPNGRPWTKAEDEMLGRAPDKAIAAELDRSVDSIRKRRMRLQIPRYHSPFS